MNETRLFLFGVVACPEVVPESYRTEAGGRNDEAEDGGRVFRGVGAPFDLRVHWNRRGEGEQDEG